MASLIVSKPSGFLYVISDSHLDNILSPGNEFVKMLEKLDNPHTVVILGDLFKIWLAPRKYWTDIHNTVFSGLIKLRDRGCNVVLIAGNREMLLPRRLDEKWKKILPFTHLSHKDWHLNWSGKIFAFIHGDTININDKKYLIWKSITHNRIFETIFQIIPGPLALMIAEALEKKLSKTNKKYKVFFPEKEIFDFAKTVLNEVDQYFVGHFHVEKEIKIDGFRGTLRIVPDWLSMRKIFQINNVGKIEILHFKNNKLSKFY